MRITAPVSLPVLVALGLITLAASCGRESPAVTRRIRSSARQPLEVSLIQLIANADAFDGEYVRVRGFYRREFEGTAIYVHREDYERRLTRNGLWVSGDVAFDQQYVLIEGRFSATRRGHLGLYSGEIGEVTRAIPWPPSGAGDAR